MEVCKPLLLSLGKRQKNIKGKKTDKATHSVSHLISCNNQKYYVLVKYRSKKNPKRGQISKRHQPLKKKRVLAPEHILLHQRRTKTKKIKPNFVCFKPFLMITTHTGPTSLPLAPSFPRPTRATTTGPAGCGHVPHPTHLGAVWKLPRSTVEALLALVQWFERSPKMNEKTAHHQALKCTLVLVFAAAQLPRVSSPLNM